MSTERTQVAIIGAGPAGLLLGRLLQRAGIAARLQDGLPLHLEASDLTIEDFDGADAQPVMRDHHDTDAHELHADFIAGCDGSHGICRAAVADRLTTWGREYPFAWRGILADCAPATDELVYARHERGFVLSQLRYVTGSRAPATTLAENDVGLPLPGTFAAGDVHTPAELVHG